MRRSFDQKIKHTVVIENLNLPSCGLVTENLQADVRTSFQVELDSIFEKSCVDTQKQIMIGRHCLYDLLGTAVTIEQVIPQSFFVGRDPLEIDRVQNQAQSLPNRGFKSVLEECRVVVDEVVEAKGSRCR